MDEAKSPEVAVFNIPEVSLSSSSGHRKMQVVGLGCGVEQLDENAVKLAVLEAIKLGYRHFDSASIYPTEKTLGEAIAEALRLGLVSSREELFITSKLWCHDAHPDLVVPALNNSLRSLLTEYVDLYLIHSPISARPEEDRYPIAKEHLLPMDYKGVWKAMEDCQRLGLTKSIGVSNFSSKKIETILSSASIPPSVNQVEVNPVWQQRKLREFCKGKGITVTAYSPLGAAGASWGSDKVMENEVLKQIAKAHGKTVAQVSLRWIVEQGVALVVKSFRKERLKENLGIFDWALTNDDHDKINQIPQHRSPHSDFFISPLGPFKTVEELWDE